MTLSLDKTWVVSQSVVNTSTVAIAANTMLVAIKDLLKANGWAVASSSDGVTNFGASDYWTDYTKITNATGNHSWIVLTNSNINNTGNYFSLCIDCNVTSAGYAYHNFYCCSSGYNVDGTLSAKPTIYSGGYEVTLLTSSSIWHAGTAGTDSKAILFRSSDYKSYRLFISSSPIYNICCWIFDVPKDPPSWWTIPYVASIAAYSVPQCNYANSCSVSVAQIKSDHNSATINFGLGSIGNATGAYGSIDIGKRPDFDGYLVMSPTYLISNTTARPGIYGTLYDLYWTSIIFESALPKGSGFLATAGSNKGLMVIGSWAQGSDGSSHTIGS
jgi:hypothetical protein